MGKYLKLEQRLKIKAMLDMRCSVANIANTLGCSRKTIYNEIKRGTDAGEYDPYYGQRQHDENAKNKGRPAKLSDKELSEYIAELISEHNLSPKKIVNLLEGNNRGFSNIPQSHITIYSAIDKGLLPNVTRESLLPKKSTVCSGGQICIPKWVLKKLDIKDGDVLSLELTENDEIVYKKVQETGN